MNLNVLKLCCFFVPLIEDLLYIVLIYPLNWKIIESLAHFTEDSKFVL